MSAQIGDWALIIKSKCGNCGIIGKIIKHHSYFLRQTHWMMEFDRGVAIAEKGARYRFMVVRECDILPVYGIDIMRNEEIANDAYKLHRGIK